jgi:hypothetical protein
VERVAASVAMRKQRFTKKIAFPLETELAFASFLAAATRGPGASRGLG